MGITNKAKEESVEFPFCYSLHGYIKGNYAPYKGIFRVLFSISPRLLFILNNTIISSQ
jgi:hypothetical protein